MRLRRPLSLPGFASLPVLLAPALALVLLAVLAGAVSGAFAPASHPPAVPGLIASQTLYGRLFEPFQREARARRDEQSRADPDYSRRIDPALAAGRVNFLLFGYGETYEPPFDRAIIGSYTLASFDSANGEIALISLTHDARAPEVERALAARGSRVGAVKIDQAYSAGGFDLMRRTIEDATGLPVDFQVSFRDTVVQDMIQDVFGALTVDVPSELETAPFFLDARQYAGADFPRGRQQMDGIQAMQFMKSLEAGPAQVVQRNTRKDLILRSLITALTTNCSDRGLWLRLSALLAREQLGGRVAYDFDPVNLLARNLGAVGSDLSGAFRLKTCGLGAPEIGRTLYIVDPGSGGDGLRWAASDAGLNPITRRDIETGVYQAGGLGVAVPPDANPYGDLVDGYWAPVRALVKRTLTAAVP